MGDEYHFFMNSSTLFWVHDPVETPIKIVETNSTEVKTAPLPPKHTAN